MIQNDLIFVEKLLKNGIITSPLLELGSGYRSKHKKNPK
jgi:hypothetical protein